MNKRQIIILVLVALIFVTMLGIIVHQNHQIDKLDYEVMVKKIQLDVCWMDIEKMVTLKIEQEAHQ